MSKLKGLLLTEGLHGMISQVEGLAKALDLDIAGVDLLFDDIGYKICEVNSNPGFEGMENYTKKNIAEEIVQFIKMKIGAFDE